MHNGKLIKIIKTFNPDEFRRFNRYLRAPFINTNEHLIKLYEYLKRYYPDFDSPKLKKEKIFSKLFPGLPFNKDKYAALIKRMIRLSEDYLLWLENENNTSVRKKQLLKVYAKRNLFDLYAKGHRQMLEILEKRPYRDLEYFRDRIELHTDYYFHPLNDKYDLEDDSLLRLMDDIDQYFVLSKLSFGNEMKSRERILKKEYDIRFLDNLMKEPKLFSHNVAVRLNFLILKLLDETNPEIFEEIETLFFSNIQNLRLNDKQRLYFYGLNHVNRQVNVGKTEFSKKALEWYKVGLKDNLLEQNGKISEISFGNIVVYGCREKEFDWTNAFIQDYENKMRAKNKTDVIQYNKGLVDFYRGNFESAFLILNNHSFGYSFQLKARLTALRVIFELFLTDHTYYDLLNSNAGAFRRFINRDKFFSDSVSESYNNTVGIIKSLAFRIIKLNSGEEIRDWFEKQTNSDKKIIVKGWLTEKVNLL